PMNLCRVAVRRACSSGVARRARDSGNASGEAIGHRPAGPFAFGSELHPVGSSAVWLESPCEASLDRGGTISVGGIPRYRRQSGPRLSKGDSYLAGASSIHHYLEVFEPYRDPGPSPAEAEEMVAVISTYLRADRALKLNRP